VADERFLLPHHGDQSDDHVGTVALRRIDSATARSGWPGRVSASAYTAFGSSAHIICQVAVARGWRVYALTREGDTETQELARSLGADWAGAVGDRGVRSRRGDRLCTGRRSHGGGAPRHGAGGTVVSAGIHMSDIPPFP